MSAGQGNTLSRLGDFTFAALDIAHARLVLARARAERALKETVA